MRTSIYSLCFIAGFTLVLSSCKKDKKQETDDTFYGTEVQVGNGTARTFATISKSGVPKEVGVVLTDQALSNLPDQNNIYVLDFDDKAKEATLFKHVAMGLSAHGHSLNPSGTIGPHFDARFYMMTLEERLAIPAPPSTKYSDLANTGFAAPPAGYLPEGYVYNLAVQKLGSHWDANTFTTGMTVPHTMIYGTWNGAVTFINPIVTLTTLSSGQENKVAFPQPQLFARQGYYATKYNIYKDAEGKHYISLSDFIKRS